MDNLFTETHLNLMPWLRQPVIKARISTAAQSLAAVDQKTGQIETNIEDLEAQPPRLNPQLLKRRAALVKALNLTDAALIDAQQGLLIRLELAALNTQKTTLADKRQVAQDKLNSDLSTLLAAINVNERPGRPEWIQQLPNQPIGAGVPVLTPRIILNAGLHEGILRHKLAFTANQIRHRDAAAAKAAKRAAQQQANDAVMVFTHGTFNTAVQAAVRRQHQQNGRKAPRNQPRHAQQRRPPNNNGAPAQRRPQSLARRRSIPAQPRAPVIPRRQQQPAGRPQSATTGNARGRRNSAPNAGPHQQSRYYLRPTDARAAHAVRNGGRRA